MYARPDIVRRYGLTQQRLLGAMGLRLGLRRPRGRAAWPWGAASELLITWSCERTPYPTLDRPGIDRPAIIVGHAVNAATQIDTWAGVALDDGIHHFAIVSVGPGGMMTEIDPLEVVTRIKSGGNWIADPPNPPSLIAVNRLSGNRPRVSWSHSRVAEQGQVEEFRVFASSGAAFNFASPAATVAYRSGRTRYEWIGSGLSEGDTRWYTVRAVTALGVMSLIPRRNAPPSGDYNAVGLEWCARITMPSAPPSDGGDIVAEALRV